MAELANKQPNCCAVFNEMLNKGQFPTDHLGAVHDFDDLLAVLRARKEALDVSFETLDHIAGVQPGYSAKLLGPTPSRQLGRMSLAAILGALGLQLVAVEDADAMARIGRRLVKRKQTRVGHWRYPEGVSV